MPYAIFLDYDDTLVPSSAAQVSDRTLRALTNAQKKGHKIFLNTGRPSSMLNIDALRGFKFDGYLCGSTYVNVGGRVILSDLMTADETQPIVAHFYGRNIPVLLEGEQSSWVVYPDGEGWEQSKYLCLEDITDAFRVCELEPISKMCVMSLLEEEDLAFLRQFGDPVLRPDAGITEIVPHGHSKGTVLQTVLVYLGWDTAKVIAIGDSCNDIPMLDCAEISVAMGNASEEVKKHAKYVTERAENHGVALVLEGLEQ